MDPNEKPRLRPLLFVKTKVEGREYIIAQDQARETQPVLLPVALERVLRLLDGKNTLRDIQAEMTRAMGGKLVIIDEITRIIDELDSHMLLDSPRYRETVELEQRFWGSAKLRKPSHAGQAYPAEPEELIEMLDGFYRNCSDSEGDGVESDQSFVRGLLAPHIDIKSGGPVFATAYSLLKKTPPADLYVLLGTAHNFTPGPFSITRKDYMTPLAVLETDNVFLDRLLDKYSPAWLTDDTAHRAEHSIEFQAIFLQHALGVDKTPKVAPILVGSFGEFLNDRKSPYEDGEVRGFVDALKSLVEEDGRKITYIVGGDLAHIGPRYGDSNTVLPMDIEECKKKDMEMLEAAAEGAEEFFNYVARERDRRNICGMPPLYTMLKLIEGAGGKILEASHWFDETTRSAVTFAAMVFN